MPDERHRLSRSAEDYLEAIGKLCHKYGEAQVSEIALMLGVKKPSVTAAMRQLAAEGLIEYRQYAPIRLTESGRAYAESVIRAHRIMRRFMQEAAGLSPRRADETACIMEHVLTYDEIHDIGRRLGITGLEADEDEEDNEDEDSPNADPSPDSPAAPTKKRQRLM